MPISPELIEYITRELMKRLAGGTPLNGGAAGPKPLLCLVGRTSAVSTPALARLAETFTICEHFNWDDPIPREASVLIASLGLQALVRVAEGDEGSTVEGRALLTALLNGRPAAALKEGLVWRRYLATAPKGLLARYARCEEILVGYGLKLVDEDQIAAALLGRPTIQPTFQPALAPTAGAPPSPAAGRRVWTEADLRAACPTARGPGQTVTLGPGDLLTPLAQDYALALCLNLVKG